MYSWKSRFRKTKTHDVADTKTPSSFSKNSDEADHQKRRISRFLRRSKHYDDTNDRPRPRSVFLERNTSDFNVEQQRNLSPKNSEEPPSVQEILDRNRRDRAVAKSPRPWRKFLSGERSPNAYKRRESGNGEKDDYSYRSKFKGENKNPDNDSSSQISNDSDRYSKYERYSEDSNGRKTGMVGTRIGRKISNDGSMRSGSDKSSEKAKTNRSRSASPYDNVDDSAKKRRERRAQSMYIENRHGDSQRDSETSSITEATPRSKRRERMRRSESQDTVNSERSARNKTLIDRESSYATRRHNKNYLADDDEYRRTPRSHAEEENGARRRDLRYRDGGENQMSETRDGPRVQVEKDIARKSPRGNRKLSDCRGSGYTTDESIRSSEKIVNRNYEQGSYSRRSSENILGATLNYIERKPSRDYIGTTTAKIIEDFNNSPREQRLHHRGWRNDKLTDNTSFPDSESEINSESARRKYSYTSAMTSYKPSAETTSSMSTTGRRSSYTKIRPKSLYDLREYTNYSESLSKFKEDANSSHAERYRSRNDYAARNEQQTTLHRPRTLFMVDDEKKESAYRGNWSVNVPTRPENMKDFSKPDERSTGYSWRKSRRERQEEADSVSVVKERQSERGDESGSGYRWRRNRKEQQDESTSGSKETGTGKGMKETVKDTTEGMDKKAGRISYIRRQSQQVVKSSEEIPESNVPAFEFTVSLPKNEEEEDKADSLKQDKKMSTLGEDTVVRRRRREHAPPARPSSIYHVNTEERIADSTPLKKEEKYQDDEAFTDDYRSRTRRRPQVNLDSEDIKAGLRKKSAVERRLRNKHTKERPKSVNLADVFAIADKGSSYLPRAKIHDPLRDTVDDVKREFDKLLRRTEDWKLRTESLNSRATVLSSSYRSLNKAITGIRDESDDMYAVIGNIGERLNANDSIGYPDTEDEWRRAFEAGKLIEKALRCLESQKRNPKPDFEYSDSESEPSTPGGPFYDMPDGIPWFPQRTSRQHSSNHLSGLSDQYSSRKSDYIDNSSRSYLSYRPSFDVGSSYALSSTRFSPSYTSDVYIRRSRYQDSIIDYKSGSSGLSVSSSTNGRAIPETAV